MTTKCNNCLDDFDVSPEDVCTVEIAGLEIQYISCPSCGAKYVGYAADDEMKLLTAESVALQNKIRMQHQHHFREKTIKPHEVRLAKVRARQKKIEPELKALAEKLLKDGEDDKQFSGLLTDD